MEYKSFKDEVPDNGTDIIIKDGNINFLAIWNNNKLLIPTGGASISLFELKKYGLMWKYE